MKLVEEAMEGYWGKRCPDYEAKCPICEAWHEYDEMAVRFCIPCESVTPGASECATCGTVRGVRDANDSEHDVRRALDYGENLEEVKLWYVVGIGGAYYGTKMQAEEETRNAFPNEDADKRYSRIYYKTVYQEV